MRPRSPSPSSRVRHAAVRPVRACVPALGMGLALMAAGWALAQAGAESDRLAREQFDRDVAVCNAGELPAPQREACVRAAGARLDRARGIVPAETLQTSPDGRATVVTPAGDPAPGGPAEPVASPDGRSSVVPNR